MPVGAAWPSATRVLCVRLDTLGDVLMTTPALRALREGGARRHLTILTSPAGAAAARLVPEIDDIIVYDAPWLKATAPRTGSEPDHEMIGRLRHRRFDAAAIFTVYSQNPLPSALLCYLAGIPLRLAHCRENPYQLLTDWVPESEPGPTIRHEVRRQLDLVATVGCRARDERLSLRVPEGATAEARSALDEAGVDPTRPWVLVHPGASAASRRYAPESFAEVARELAGRYGWQVVFSGSAGERALVDQIRRDTRRPACSLAGRLDFGGLAAAIGLAPLLLSNNTGPVHVAAALGTPVVDLYALTNPQHTPWMVPHRVLSHDVPCKYCYRSVCPQGHHDCLQRITPAQVVAAVVSLANETRRQPAWPVPVRAPEPVPAARGGVP